MILCHSIRYYIAVTNRINCINEFKNKNSNFYWEDRLRGASEHKHWSVLKSVGSILVVNRRVKALGAVVEKQNCKDKFLNDDTIF